MKVKSLLIAAFAAISMTALAGGTAERDKVYIKDFEAKVGETVEIPVYFDTQTPYAAAQADLYFPEGVTPVEYKTKKWLKKATSERWDEDAPHSLSQNNPIAKDGIYEGKVVYRYVLAELSSNATFAAGDSPMLTISVKIEKEGTLKGGINRVHWSTGIPNDYSKDGDGPETEFTITATSTGINDVTAADAVKAYKVIENGQIYIVNGDKKYNVMGAEVK